MITIKMIPVKMPPEYHLNFVQNGTRGGSFVFSVSASRFCARLSCSSRGEHQCLQAVATGRSDDVPVPVREADRRPAVFSLYIRLRWGGLRRLSVGTRSVARLGGIITGVTLTLLSHARLSRACIVELCFVVLHEAASRATMVSRTAFNK